MPKQRRWAGLPVLFISALEACTGSTPHWSQPEPILDHARQVISKRPHFALVVHFDAYAKPWSPPEFYESSGKTYPSQALTAAFQSCNSAHDQKDCHLLLLDDDVWPFALVGDSKAATTKKLDRDLLALVQAQKPRIEAAKARDHALAARERARQPRAAEPHQQQRMAEPHRQQRMAEPNPQQQAAEPQRQEHPSSRWIWLRCDGHYSQKDLNGIVQRMSFNDRTFFYAIDSQHHKLFSYNDNKKRLVEQFGASIDDDDNVITYYGLYINRRSGRFTLDFGPHDEWLSGWVGECGLSDPQPVATFEFGQAAHPFLGELESSAPSASPAP